jgi:hypothetical protein
VYALAAAQFIEESGTKPPQQADHSPYRQLASSSASKRCSTRRSVWRRLLICVKPLSFELAHAVRMTSFTYRCPRTGQIVHGHPADELINGETYVPMTCTACGGTHLVNPRTGKTLDHAKK